MVAALPVSKLLGLVIKTLAKPMAKRIKHECNRSTTAIKMLQAVGEATHQVTSRMTIWSAGYKVQTVKPLPCEEAQKRGAEFIGESFVLLVAGAVVIVEYNGSKEKEKKKEQARIKEMSDRSDELEVKLVDITTRLKALEAQHNEHIEFEKKLNDSITKLTSTTERRKSWLWGSTDV